MANMSFQTSISVAPALGYAGMVDAGAPNYFVTGRNDEASASIPFGKAVVWDPSSPATDISVTLPANQTDPVMGIVAFSQRHSRAWVGADGNTYGELDATGLRPGTIMNVLRKGRILVVAASTVVAGVSKLYVRRTATGGEALGDLEDAADGTDMIDCSTKGTWMTSATAGSLAWLEVDFT